MCLVPKVFKASTEVDIHFSYNQEKEINEFITLSQTGKKSIPMSKPLPFKVKEAGYKVNKWRRLKIYWDIDKDGNFSNFSFKPHNEQ